MTDGPWRQGTPLGRDAALRVRPPVRDDSADESARSPAQGNAAAAPGGKRSRPRRAVTPTSRSGDAPDRSGLRPVTAADVDDLADFLADLAAGRVDLPPD